ncbi:hypothetical protein BJD99_14715 [Rhodococcus sp. 1163]|nr:hypothetical protein BJD99_14715 [Rhodococcus sp. 1163]
MLRRTAECGRNDIRSYFLRLFQMTSTGDFMGSAAGFISDIFSGVLDGLVESIVDQIVGVLTSGSAA